MLFYFILLRAKSVKLRYMHGLLSIGISKTFVAKHLCSLRQKVTEFSASNNLKPSPVPEELKNLRKILQQLIVKSNPVMNVYQTNALGQAGQRFVGNSKCVVTNSSIC